MLNHTYLEMHRPRLSAYPLGSTRLIRVFLGCNASEVEAEMTLTAVKKAIKELQAAVDELEGE